MTTEKKEPVKRTPKSPGSITAGAMKLPLADRIELCKALQKSIETEVKALKEQAQQAEGLAAGLNSTPMVKAL